MSPLVPPTQITKRERTPERRVHHNLQPHISKSYIFQTSTSSHLYYISLHCKYPNMCIFTSAHVSLFSLSLSSFCVFCLPFLSPSFTSFISVLCLFSFMFCSFPVFFLPLSVSISLPFLFLSFLGRGWCRRVTTKRRSLALSGVKCQKPRECCHFKRFAASLSHHLTTLFTVSS